MIVHPNVMTDPKYFLSDLEVLLRRYDVTIESAAVAKGSNLIVFTGFRGRQWMRVMETCTIDHKKARKLYEIAEAAKR